MRMYMLLVAIATNIYAVHALPPTSVPPSSGAAPDSLKYEKHEFHHFDRNQQTADIGHETGVHGSNVEGSGLYFVKRERVGEAINPDKQTQRKNTWQSPPPIKPQQAKRWKMTKEGKVLNTRFIKNPDYSQGGNGGGGDGSNPASPASEASPTPSQEPNNSPPPAPSAAKLNAKPAVPA